MSIPAIPRVAIAGLGGFASNHHNTVRALESQGLCKLVATCDPNIHAYTNHGLKLFDSLDDMLSEPLDIVLLPTPIPLHRAQHQQVIEAGCACYLEKPPTLSWTEYLAMVQVEKEAKFQTQVGFNFVGDPFRQEIKSRILDGEFGDLQGATLNAIWPRNLAYYQRNNWAGKRTLDGQPVNDSCIGNALAHYVQNLLFWCGNELQEVAKIYRVEAQLLRAHPIESFDTAFVKAEMSNGKWIRIAATHTGTDKECNDETIYCDSAIIYLPTPFTARIVHSNGQTEELVSKQIGSGVNLEFNLSNYFQYWQGNLLRPTTTLEDSRSFVALHTLCFESAGEIQPFKEERITRDESSGRVAVSNLDQELQLFAEQGAWPHEAPTTISASTLPTT